MDEKHTFRPSKPGERRGGRAKGTPNKQTVAVREALIEAFDKLGGVPSLVRWAKKDETEFYKLWGKMLPTEIKGSVGVTLDKLIEASLTLVDGK